MLSVTRPHISVSYLISDCASIPVALTRKAPDCIQEGPKKITPAPLLTPKSGPVSATAAMDQKNTAAAARRLRMIGIRDHSGDIPNSALEDAEMIAARRQLQPGRRRHHRPAPVRGDSVGRRGARRG